MKRGSELRQLSTRLVVSVDTARATANGEAVFLTPFKRPDTITSPQQ